MEREKTDLVPVGKVANMFGVHVDTVRDWTAKGKLQTTRTLGNHRRYSLSEVKRLMEGQSGRDNRGVEKD